MTKPIHFKFQDKDTTTFEFDETGQLLISQLLGLPSGFDGRNEGPSRVRGLAILDTNIGCFEADRLRLVQSEFDQDSAFFAWSAGDDKLRLESKWTFCNRTGLWSRRDTLHNISDAELMIFRCQARFSFAPGRYEIYSQSSRWCHENQGIWQNLFHGGIALQCEGGRTTQAGTPYVCLRAKDSGCGLAFHILPRGNWVIKINTRTAGGDSLPFTVVELGLADESLNLKLEAGSSFELPEILIQPLQDGQPERAAPRLHSYLQTRHFNASKPTAPLVYNTWFDAFDALDPERLRKQLTAAKEIGCEVFTVDAGWYGGEAVNWWQSVGDWREKSHAAFKGRMSEFADEVHAAGLGFGLWMEPERNFASVPAVKEHPDWFLAGSSGCYYPDLTNPAAYDYILSEMSRLVETYELAWMKVDFNFELYDDSSRSEFAHYYDQWYRLLDELRARFPKVFFEGCASGGMRLDLNTLGHFDGHFLSDNVNPADVLRIYQQALLRLPPGRLMKWIVLRSVGQAIPQYGLPVDEAPYSLVTPAGSGATWEKSETATIDFAARVALPGMPGLSGDIAGLPSEAKKRLHDHIKFYKKWRNFIVGSIAHLLTPCRPKEDHRGWAAIQLQHSQKQQNLLFAYRLDDACDKKCFRVRGLDPKRKYTISDEDCPGKNPEQLSGAQLMNEGLAVALPQRYSAAVKVLSTE